MEILPRNLIDLELYYSSDQLIQKLGFKHVLTMNRAFCLIDLLKCVKKDTQINSIMTDIEFEPTQKALINNYCIYEYIFANYTNGLDRTKCFMLTKNLFWHKEIINEIMHKIRKAWKQNNLLFENLMDHNSYQHFVELYQKGESQLI